MKCKNCGKEIQDDWKVCPFCMEPVVKERFCSNCNRKLDPEWKICPYCQTPVTGVNTQNLRTPPQMKTPFPTDGIVYSGGPLQGMGYQGLQSGSSYSQGMLVPEIELPAGTVLDERYTVKKKLGQGGYGAVFLCDDSLMNEEVVLKVMPDLNPQFLKSVVMEYKARTKIRDQKNIIMAYNPDKITYNGQDFIIYPMEYADGGSLREQLPGLHEIENPAEKERKILNYFEQMCKGVRSIHEAGIVHLDIKPENFLFRKGTLKVADFGISRNLQEHDIDISEIQEGIGSGPYMAPEQYETANPLGIDEQADIYALGVILYEMFSEGMRPYEGKDLGRKKRQYYPPKKLKNISPDYWAVIEKCLAPEIDNRYIKVEEVLSALKQSSGTIDELLSKGKTLFKQKKYPEALKIFTNILSFDPQQKEAGEYQDKIEEIQEAEKAKQEQEKQVAELLKKADPLFKSKKYKEAKEVYTQILSIDEYNSEAKKQLEEIVEIEQGKEEEREKKKQSLLSKRNMIFVEGGGFLMGSGDYNGELDHRVNLNSFYIGKYEVTFADYDTYCKDMERTKHDDRELGRGERPVIYVSWYDAIRYCNWLSKRDGLYPCYSMDGDPELEDYDDKELKEVDCDFEANGYRLPTEAEWEYAARGGNKSKGYTYSGSNNRGEVAWHEDNSDDKTHPVGKKQPNELDIYDMSGNVWEWCWDWFDRDYYSNSPQNNPKGPSSGLSRVLRGGSWGSNSCQVAYRYDHKPGNSNVNPGIRLVKNTQ